VGKGLDKLSISSEREPEETEWVAHSAPAHLWIGRRVSGRARRQLLNPSEDDRSKNGI